MVSNGDPWGYVALAAAGIAYVIYRLRATTRAAALDTEPDTAPDPKTEPAPRADVPDPAGARAALPCSVATPEPEPEPEPAPDPELPLRRLDTVYVRCESTTHAPDSVPVLTLTRDRIVAVRLTLERQGWTNTATVTLCPVHNPLGQELAAVHIRCDTPGCGERAGMRLADLAGAFGRCHFDGWRNRGPRVVCPYCSGVREHRNA